MYESIPITRLKIKGKTKQSLCHLGYTETGNFINMDDVVLAKNLPKEQYIDLAIAMAAIKARIIWEETKTDNKSLNLIHSLSSEVRLAQSLYYYEDTG